MKFEENIEEKTFLVLILSASVLEKKIPTVSIVGKHVRDLTKNTFKQRAWIKNFDPDRRDLFVSKSAPSSFKKNYLIDLNNRAHRNFQDGNIWVIHCIGWVKKSWVLSDTKTMGHFVACN